MAKFLLTIVASLFAVLSFASEKVDTLFFQKGEAGNCLLELDTVKYPYLTEENVSWFIGFPDVYATEDGENVAVCAKQIPSGDIVTMADGKKYFHMENLGDSWFTVGSYPHRTITLFNSHKVQGTKSIKDDNDKVMYYELSDFEGSICDTVAVLHILKDLKAEDVTDLSVVTPKNGENGKYGSKFTAYEGDTVKVSVKIAESAHTNYLDVQQYVLASVEGKNFEDTTVIVASEEPDFYFIPEQSYDKVVLLIANEKGYVAKSEWEKAFTFIPKFTVEGVSYTQVTNGESYTKEVIDTTFIDVNVHKGDSVSLDIISNYSEAKPKLICTWNKDGVAVPVSDTIRVENNGLSLTFAAFDFEEMHGTYNCIITDKNTGETVTTVSFKVHDSLATANETIVANNTSIKVYDNVLYLNGVQGEVKVYSMVGSLVKTILANGGVEQYPLNLKSGVYLIVNNGNTSKVVVR